MNKSDTISELAKSLCKVQGELHAAKKGAENPFFKSKYADLLSVWDACRIPLTGNGLSVVQTADVIDGDHRLILETTLLHESGEWISSRLAIPLVKDDPQALGSAMTYGRRYSLSAIIGLCTEEDDDGEQAMVRKATPKSASRPTQNQQDLRQDDPEQVSGVDSTDYPNLHIKYSVSFKRCWEHDDEWRINKNGGWYHKMPDGTFCNFNKLLPVGEIARLKFKTSDDFKAWVKETTGKEYLGLSDIEKADVLESILQESNEDNQQIQST